MKVDLRSDTVTQPSKAMLAAMMQAKLGDDVFGDDPTVIALEEKASKLFKHEAALFCPSGTMTNQIAIQVHTQSPAEVICDTTAHIYRYEGGGIAYNANCSVRLIQGDRGRFTLSQLKKEINPNDIHFPPSQLLSIENTSNKGGGSTWEMNDLQEISAYCKRNKMPLHMDGARLFNALVAKNIDAEDIGPLFDSISICLSKGLGCPVGSLLIGSNAFIHKARRIRKIMGGGMRQAGILAAAGIYALDHNIDRLKDDHQRAKSIVDHLKSMPYVEEILPSETNIVIFKLKENVPMDKFIAELSINGIGAASMGPQSVRFVTHLGIDDEDIQYLIDVLKQLA